MISTEIQTTLINSLNQLIDEKIRGPIIEKDR